MNVLIIFLLHDVYYYVLLKWRTKFFDWKTFVIISFPIRIVMTTLRHKELICIILCIQLKLMTVLCITTLITELFVGVGTLPSFFLKHLNNSIISHSNRIGLSPYDYFGPSSFIGATVQGQESERSCICVVFFMVFVFALFFFWGGGGLDLVCVYDFPTVLWNCSDSLLFTIPTSTHHRR